MQYFCKYYAKMLSDNNADSETYINNVVYSKHI